MKHVFGPVPSRRLGQSLGIDTIPLKTCNWNCVYCQLGRTVPLTNERREYVLDENFLFEVERVLMSRTRSGIDWVTFVGSGEPTLHLYLGEIIRRVKALTALPVAVITNGSLFYLPEVRQELSAADAVLPTLDAGTPELYRKINRPHPDITFERLVDGLSAFREEYQGKLWVEVMLVRGLNDSTQALEDVARVLHRVKPDAVHINLPTRPPCETWVQPPDEEGMMRAISIIGGIAKVVHPAEGSFDLGGYENVADAIVEIITRHPMRQDELVRTLSRWSSETVDDALEALQSSGRAQIVERLGTRFWSAASSLYPNQRKSHRASPDTEGSSVMFTNKNDRENIPEDIHTFLETTLIETYLKGKGYTLEDLQKLPEEEAKQLRKEASTYASGKLAEVEVKARMVRELHDAFTGE